MTGTTPRCVPTCWSLSCSSAYLSTRCSDVKDYIINLLPYVIPYALIGFILNDLDVSVSDWRFWGVAFCLFYVDLCSYVMGLSAKRGRV